MLVALRVSVGWHFLYQGMHKISSDFSSEAFLRQSKGPLQPMFRGMIFDADGRVRLWGGRPDYWVGSPDGTLPGRWNEFSDRFRGYYQLGPDQEKELEATIGAHKKVLRHWFRSHGGDIGDYLTELERLEANRTNPRYAGVTYYEKRMYEKQQELQADLRGLMSDLEDMDQRFKRDLFAVLDADQLARQGRMAESWTLFDYMNGLIIFSNLAIGVCLIAGLFTRFAAWSGAAFLFLIVLSQPAWPGYYPPPPPAVGHAMIVNKEFVEMIALMVIGATVVGRWGGLDFFVHEYVTKPYFNKQPEGQAT